MMAREIISHEKIIVLTKKETANIIALLAGQLAEEAITNHFVGESPNIHVEAEDGTRYRLAFVVDKI
jgi:hypothetical protein